MAGTTDKRIQFHYLAPRFQLDDRNKLKQFILHLFTIESKQVDSINYIFCTDEYLLAINQQHLNHNDYTDIITFEYSGFRQPIVSDIYISIERVKENAALYKKSFPHELLRVVFHGALHLCGYKDKRRADSILMRQKEDEYLNLYLFHVK